MNASVEILRGLQIFNVPIGDERYVLTTPREKARHVGKITRQYVEDVEEEYSQEIWTLLQFSLQHRILVADMYTGENAANGGTRGLAHRGDGTCNGGGGLRWRGSGKGETKNPSEDEGKRN